MPKTDTEYELLQQARQGNQEAFKTLTDACRSHVTACCARMLHNSREDGEQAAQDAFLLAWESLPEFQENCPFANWVLTIARRVCLNILRTKKERMEAGSVRLDDPNCVVALTLVGGNNTAEESILRVLPEQLLREVRHQGQKHRPPWDRLDEDIFFCRLEQEAASFAEIARILKVDVGTVKYRYSTRIQPVLDSLYAKFVS